MPEPEAIARQAIDAALGEAGWQVQDFAAVNLSAARGVAVREFPLRSGHGAADYLLFSDGEAVGVVEAKAEGTTLSGVETQSARYSAGLPAYVPAPVRPLPFLYQSTGVETRFTNLLDPEPRSRPLFSFHRPETLAAWLLARPSTLRGRLRTLPPAAPGSLWPAQRQAVQNIERSLAADYPRSLVQMATGSGKTLMAIATIYQLVKFGGVQRVLFLVDRRNLGQQTLAEFQQYVTPDDGRRFGDLYNVTLLESNHIDPADKVVITTIQRLYAILRGDTELDPALEEGSQFQPDERPLRDPVAVRYNPAVPIETFDLILTDECHRSIYHLWRQVLEYFDAFLVGLTATPSKQTLGFFRQNLVMEYSHEQAVADGVNVDFDVYRIRTAITERGATVESGLFVDKRDRATRRRRWEQLDEDFTYDPRTLDRAVVAEDQLRTVLRAFRDALPAMFPGRREVPKTLIFAKDDSHAEDIVQVVREEFGRGNEFAEKITYQTGVARIPELRAAEDGSQYRVMTYKSTGVKAEHLIAAFRNSYYPRIAVTVDMIATGTDIKPIEIVVFMRPVRSRLFFEQMKGRGVRTIDDDSFQGVTPDARTKTRFVLVDCVGVCEQEFTDSQPLDREPSVSFGQLLKQVALGSTDPDALSSLASRLLRLDRQLPAGERERLAELAGGTSLPAIARGIIEALEPERQIAAAREEDGLPADAEPSPEQVARARRLVLRAAVAPLAANPPLRHELEELRRHVEQTIDTVSQDAVLETAYSTQALERARALTTSFEQYVEANRDEITALQVLYSRPYRQRLRYRDIKALARAIAAPPRSWTTEALWQAYETLDRAKVRGSAGTTLTNIVSLVRYALHQEPELRPFPERVQERFARWLAQRARFGPGFTAEQARWLELIRDHIAGNVEIDLDDLDLPPFKQRGGPGKALQVFGQDLPKLLEELNEVLAA